MAMLAGPRRKQKVINLRAKNSEWSNDANKFGQRMLEKMGWSSGKGLGAHENGMVEHVIAKYKNDEKGLGFEDKNDQWTKHEDDFNSLLANLSNGDKNEIKLHSGVSLEVKSKKSKARVHYHKFTRGKDLTRYSEKDLANIFGKKTLKNEPSVEELTNVQEITTAEVQSTEQVFTEKGSMEDYFKNKFAALKSKCATLAFNNKSEDYEAECGFQGFSAGTESDDQQNIGFHGFSCYNTDRNDNEQSNDLVEPELKNSRKNKKSKKKSQESINHSEEVQVSHSFYNTDDRNDNEQSNDLVEPELKNSRKNKKSKKNQGSINHNEEIQVGQNGIEEVESTENEPKTKKKKSKKNKQESEALPEITEKIKKRKTEIETASADNIIEEDSYVPKKKKKRKNKEN